MLMKDFSVSVQVDASPDRVWAVMSDIERWHEWTPTVISITKKEAGPLRVGAVAHIRQPKVPPTDWTITALEHGRGFEWRAKSPGVKVTARHAVEAQLGGTRATLSIQFHGVLGGVIGRLTSGMNRRYLALEAEGLKRRAEAGAAYA